MALDVGDYVDYDSFEEAMERFAADMTEVMPWNEWQRYAAEIADKYEGATRDKKELAALRKVTMAGKFGPDWQKRSPTTARLRTRVLQTVDEERATADVALADGVAPAGGTITPRAGEGTEAAADASVASPLRAGDILLGGAVANEMLSLKNVFDEHQVSASLVEILPVDALLVLFGSRSPSASDIADSGI